MTQIQLERKSQTVGPESEVVELIEHIWKEATGELDEILSVPVAQMKIDQVPAHITLNTTIDSEIVN